MAHFALQKLHILPAVFIGLPQREQAFIYASTLVRIEEEKRENERLKMRSGRR